MQRITAVIQFIFSIISALIAAATAINLGFILLRPDSISVANVLVGQMLLIICFLALATLLFRKGRSNLRKSASD